MSRIDSRYLLILSLVCLFVLELICLYFLLFSVWMTAYPMAPPMAWGNRVVIWLAASLLVGIGILFVGYKLVRIFFPKK